MTDLLLWQRNLLHRAALAEGDVVVVTRSHQNVARALEARGLVERRGVWQCSVTPAGWAEAHRRWPDTVAAPPQAAGSRSAQEQKTHNVPQTTDRKQGEE